MLKFIENLKCEQCGDSVECRLCSVVVGKIEGSQVVSCDRMDNSRKIKHSMLAANKKDRILNIKLAQ